MKILSAEETLRMKLQALLREHRDLNDRVDALARSAAASLDLQRLKRKKLMLKDQIARLQDRLNPDIIA